MPAMNLTITVPEGSTNHGSLDLLCTPPKWYDYIIFFLTNYLAHAATVISLPGQSVAETLCAAILALLVPSTGIMRAFEVFFRRPALKTRDPLRRAAAAKALCMVVKLGTSSGYIDVDSSQFGWMEDVDIVREGTTIHGQSHLPDGYAFAYVPEEAAAAVRQRAAPSQEEGEVTGKKEPLTGAIAATYNLPKALISFAQALWAIVSLYRARGDQIDEYGYAAFGLTVAPYAYMSLVNLTATCLTPEYPAVYMVRTTIMAEAEAKGAFIVGDIGELDLTQVAAGTFPKGVVDVAFYLGFLLSLPPLAVVGGLSHFQSGHSSALERGFTMVWLAVGMVGGMWGYLLLEIFFAGSIATEGYPPPRGSRGRFAIIFFALALPLFVPAVGGMVVVGKMLREFGGTIVGKRKGFKPKKGLHKSPCYLDKRIWRHGVWYRYYRMILYNPKTDTCQLSGTSYYIKEDGPVLRVPWDEDTVAIAPDIEDLESALFATAFVRDPEHEQSIPDTLTGMVVHTKCWDRLTVHRLWTVCGQDLHVVMEALYSHRAEACKVSGYLNCIELSAGMARDFGVDMYAEPKTRRLIRRARLRTAARFKVEMPTNETCVKSLPVEILFQIADLLDIKDVEDMQEGICFYLGDRYWKSRIPEDQLEVLPLSGKEVLDWQFLCVELDALSDNFWSTCLDGREQVKDVLDRMANMYMLGLSNALGVYVKMPLEVAVERLGGPWWTD
ncbi:hypothetical protein BDV18DRAFT_163988 [Aspergillus unguis]